MLVLYTGYADIPRIVQDQFHQLLFLLIHEKAVKAEKSFWAPYISE